MATCDCYWEQAGVAYIAWVTPLVSELLGAAGLRMYLDYLDYLDAARIKRPFSTDEAQTAESPTRASGVGEEEDDRDGARPVLRSFLRAVPTPSTPPSWSRPSQGLTASPRLDLPTW